MSRIAEHVAERLDHRGLARPRNTGESDAQSVARLRQKTLQHTLRQFEMPAAVALDERDRARERHAVAAFHTHDIVILGENEFAVRHALSIQQVRIDIPDGQILDSLNTAHNTRREFAVGILRHPVRPLSGVLFAHSSSFHGMAKRRPQRESGA